MLPKCKKFISTHIPHILSIIALVIFTTLALSMVYTAHTDTAENQAKLIEEQTSITSINTKNATQLLEALKAEDPVKVEESLIALQKGLKSKTKFNNIRI